jgi:hypothetical protein
MVLSSSPIAIPFLVAQLIASARPAHIASGDTVLRRADSISTATRVDSVPVARVAFDFGFGLGSSFAARGVELRVAGVPATSPKAQPTTAIQVRFIRIPDSLSADLTDRVASGSRISEMQAELPGRAGAPATTIRLYDVQVVSTRLTMNDDNIGLVQQRLGLEESIAQLTTELQEAQRQLEVTESLDKRKMSSSLEVAHARATTEVLTKRLAVEREHLVLIEQQIAHWTPIQEEIVLTAARMQMETR